MWRAAVPQTDHDHNEPEIYNDSLSNHVSSFEHQGHEHQSKEPGLFLPG